MTKMGTSIPEGHIQEDPSVNFILVCDDRTLAFCQLEANKNLGRLYKGRVEVFDKYLISFGLGGCFIYIEFSEIR